MLYSFDMFVTVFVIISQKITATNQIISTQICGQEVGIFGCS